MPKKISLEIGIKKRKSVRGANAKKKSPAQDPETNEERKKERPLVPIVFFLLVLTLVVLFCQRPKESQSETEGRVARTATLTPELQTIRIATWNLFPLDFNKISNPERGGLVAEVIQSFDIAALQGIRSNNTSVLDLLIHRLQGLGKKYDYVYSSDVSDHGYTAFVYNIEKVLPDRESSTTLLSSNREQGPSALVLSFRTLGISPDRAFTFTLVNIQIEDRDPPSKRDHLYSIYETLRARSAQNGVGEDDLILLGTISAPPERLGMLARVPNLVAVHVDKTTRIDGMAADNILFDSRAVTEYIERFGVLDLKERFHLSEFDVRGISEHRPLWADFTIAETGP